MRFAFRRDLAVGRYVPLDTPVHRLDPRTKLLLFLAVLIALFRADLVGDAVLAAALAGATALARIPVRRVAAGLRALGWIFALTFLFQVFWAGPTRLGGM
ncbi:MAG TPA: hypothetical protein VKU85_19650, partial [bacterium]|nr:hypothetical protein [bacterium]